MPGGRGGAEPSATQAFGYAWGLAKQDFAGVVLPPAVAFLLSMVINIGLNLLMVPVKVALGVKVGVAAGVKAGVATGLVMGAIIDALIAVPAIAAGAFFTGGIYLFASRLVRGQKPGFGEVFGGMQVFGPALVAMLGTVGLPAILRPLLGLVPFVGTGLGTLLIFAGGFSYSWAVAVAVEQRLSDTRHQGGDGRLGGGVSGSGDVAAADAVRRARRPRLLHRRVRDHSAAVDRGGARVPCAQAGGRVSVDWRPGREARTGRSMTAWRPSS
jgi:hypothetical protein